MSIFGVLRRYVENGEGASKWVGRDDRNYKSIFGGLRECFRKLKTRRSQLGDELELIRFGIMILLPVRGERKKNRVDS